VNSIQTLDNFTNILNEFKKLFKSFKDKPEKWTLVGSKIIFYYKIKDNIINYFSKIVRRNRDWSNSSEEGYPFEDYHLLRSQLNVKTDGSMYAELHQLRGPGVNSAKDGSEITERFKKHMLEEYKCKFTFTGNDGHYFFFNVL
jgi:hypothetical protein